MSLRVWILAACAALIAGAVVLVSSGNGDLATQGTAASSSIRAVASSGQATEQGDDTPSPMAAVSGDASKTTGYTQDWALAVHASADDFLLVQELANAALMGDSRAEYFLAEVLLRCEVQKRTLAPFGAGTVAERVELYLADQRNASERSRSTFRREALRCARVFAENPLAAYELPEDARDFRYWSARALASGDPLAVMNRAYRSVADRRNAGGPEEARAFRNALLKDVRTAVFSGDGAALFAVGGLFADPSLVDDPLHGYAWQVAACESGHDCSKGNPYIGFGCIEEGTCVAGETWTDVLERDLGAAKYAAVYASAQDIQYKIRTNDWDGLQQYLQLRD
jgi:hypothetical protein